MTRWPLLALALIACALTFAACGGDSGGKEDSDAAAVLAQTFDKEKDVRSGRLDMNLKVDTSTPSTVRLSGPFEQTEKGAMPRFDFSIAVEGGGDELKLGAISTGDKGFLRFRDETYAMNDELFAQLKKGYTDQAAKTGSAGGPGFQTLGVDPRGWLKDPKVEGTEQSGGVEATHLTAGVDVPKFLDDLGAILQRPELSQAAGSAAKLSEEQKQVIAESVKEADVELWSGVDDRILRRMNVALRFDVPEASRRNSRGLTRGDVRFDMSLGAVNEGQSIKAPAGAKPLEELLARFGGQVPGLGGAQAPPGGAQAPQGGAQAPQGGQQSSEYLQCVQQAGQDVKKLQACADLIGR